MDLNLCARPKKYKTSSIVPNSTAWDRRKRAKLSAEINSAANKIDSNVLVKTCLSNKGISYYLFLQGTPDFLLSISSIENPSPVIDRDNYVSTSVDRFQLKKWHVNCSTRSPMIFFMFLCHLMGLENTLCLMKMVQIMEWIMTRNASGMLVVMLTYSKCPKMMYYLVLIMVFPWWVDGDVIAQFG